MQRTPAGETSCSAVLGKAAVVLVSRAVGYFQRCVNDL
jgi:hypothetical protein